MTTTQVKPGGQPTGRLRWGRHKNRNGAVTLVAASSALLAYVLVGYPLLAAAIARVRPRPIRDDRGYLPFVSIVIAAFDESEAIDAKIDSCLALDYPRERVEVIVVADGSTDDTADRAASHEGVVVLADPVRRGKAAALGRGVAAAGGDVVVFTDANNLLMPDALREIVRPLGDPAVGCVTGRKAIDDGSGRPLDAAEGLYWRYEARIRRWENQWGSVSSVNGELLALRREAIAPLSASTVNDDFTLAMEAAIAGWRIAYAESAVSLEPASATTAGESTRRERIVAGRWVALRQVSTRLVRRDPVLAWQVLSHKALRLVMPFAGAGLVVGNLAALGRRTWTAPLLLLQCVFYGAACLGWLLERRRARSLLTYLPYYLVRMNVVTLLGLVRAARDRSSLVRWERVPRG